MEKGMNPNHMSWHHVTLLHDMAQKGNFKKAELLIKYGADMDPVEEEYQSTPLGMAARWGHVEMVSYLLSKGADINKAGATWATPLAWGKEKKGMLKLKKFLWVPELSKKKSIFKDLVILFDNNKMRHENHLPTCNGETAFGEKIIFHSEPVIK
jgi:ankyrin repeat protein